MKALPRCRSYRWFPAKLGHQFDVYASDWRDPVLAYGMQGLGMDPHVSCDLDLCDFRHVVDFLLADDMIVDIECRRERDVGRVMVALALMA